MDLITQTATPTTLVNGLQADYYEGRNFNTLRQTKLDPTVNLWASSAPSSSLPADNFSVRWTGQVQPKYSETYTFYTNSDDGIRLWVNGAPLIDNWLPHPATENSSTITLNAGQLYTIQLDYYDLASDAVAQLMWSSPSQTKEIIPPSQLFSNSPVKCEFSVGSCKTCKQFYQLPWCQHSHSILRHSLRKLSVNQTASTGVGDTAHSRRGQRSRLDSTHE